MRDRTGAGETESVQRKASGGASSGAVAQKPEGGGGMRVQLRSMGSYDEQVQRLAPPGEDGGAGAAPAGGGGLDTASVERWIQSALNLLLGSGLSIDGVMAGPTKAAVKTFQKKAPELTGQRLQVDGIAGSQTIKALEGATNGAAPDKREADTKKEAAPAQTEGAGGGGGDAAGAETKEAGGGVGNVMAAWTAGAAQALPADGVVEGQVQAEINNLGAQQQSGDGAGTVVDMARAYEEAKAWTMGQLVSKQTKRAQSTHTKLIAKHQQETEAFAVYQTMDPKKGRAPADPGPKDAYIEKNWFRAYWMLWCYQFAAKVSEFLDGKKGTSLQGLVAQTSDAAAKGEAEHVKGRTTLHRGQTLAQAGGEEAVTGKLAPGTSMHVKLHFEGDNPYEHKDDFHHWMVYAGNGKFSDTLTGKDKSGAAMDASLKNWVKGSFKNKDYAFMHGDPRFATNVNGKVKPLPNLQPLISAEFDPRQSVKKEQGH